MEQRMEAHFEKINTNCEEMRAIMKVYFEEIRAVIKEYLRTMEAKKEPAPEETEALKEPQEFPEGATD
jgi:uncharacterized protein Yka (UPF0111/DUF47 family)